MASTPTDPGGQDNNKNIANRKNKMDADTINHPMDSDTEETPSHIPWSLENWRLDIRTPPKRKNDNSSHAFSPVTAFKNFIQATFAFKDTAIRFHSLSNDTDFIDSSTAPFPKDDTLTEQYMRGALGRFEHGTIKYFLQFRVGFQSTSFDSIKACLLPYLQFHNSWLAQNSFPTLEIYAAGAFSLRHPHWTRLHNHHKAIRDLIWTHIDSIDLTLLTPDQRTSLEPLLADQTIPHFELHIQAIRAHLPVETTAPGTNDADTYSKSEDSKPSATVLKTSAEFIVTDCIELRCEKQFTEFFCTALESATANDVWAVGRFFNHTLRSDSPELHFACISEQHLFAKNTRYIQIQWAHPIALLSQVNFHTIPAFSNLEEPPSLPTLPQFMQTLQGTLPNDQMTTPQFLSLEPTDFKGTWKLLCHRELLQENRAWFDDHFLTLYQRTTGYKQLAAEDPRFKAPHRRDD